MSTSLFRLSIAAFVVVGLFVALQAQEPGAKGPPNDKGKKVKLFELPKIGGKGGKASSGSVLDALRDKKVQEEIGLIPEQVAELEALAQQVAKELEPLAQEFKSLSKAEQEAQLEGFQRDLAAYMRGVQADVDRILLPEQQQRLRQVALQLQMQKAGPTEALLSPAVLRSLAISEAQAQVLREKLLKIEEEYRQQLVELEIEKEKKILAQFTPAQQEKLKSLIGAMLPGKGGGKGKQPPAP